MYIDLNVLTKNTKRVVNGTTSYISKNKHLFIEGALGGLLATVGINDWIKEKKNKEKMRLYQKEIQIQHAEIETLKDAVTEAENLKKVNVVLADVIEEMKTREEDVI